MHLMIVQDDHEVMMLIMIFTRVIIVLTWLDYYSVPLLLGLTCMAYA